MIGAALWIVPGLVASLVFVRLCPRRFTGPLEMAWYVLYGGVVMGLVGAAITIIELPQIIRERHIAHRRKLNADYREVLRLIEWQPPSNSVTRGELRHEDTHA